MIRLEMSTSVLCRGVNAPSWLLGIFIIKSLNGLHVAKHCRVDFNQQLLWEFSILVYIVLLYDDELGSEDMNDDVDCL